MKPNKKQERMKNLPFKIIQFFKLKIRSRILIRIRIWIRTSKSDPDPNKSRSDPQHWQKPVRFLLCIPVPLYHLLRNLTYHAAVTWYHISLAGLSGGLQQGQAAQQFPTCACPPVQPYPGTKYTGHIPVPKIGRGIEPAWLPFRCLPCYDYLCINQNTFQSGYMCILLFPRQSYW